MHNERSGNAASYSAFIVADEVTVFTRRAARYVMYIVRPMIAAKTANVSHWKRWGMACANAESAAASRP